MRKLAKLLHSLKEARSAEHLKLCFMDQTEEALESDMVALYLFEPETLLPAEIHLRHLSDSFAFEYEQLRRDGEPGYERLMHTRGIISDTIVYPGEEWKRSLLYRLNKKYRMGHYLCAPILIGGKITGMLGLGRRCEGAFFRRRAGERAKKVCRALSARLLEFSRDKEGTPSFGERTIEHFGRLRAVRALLRTHLDQLERQSFPLSSGTAASLWGELASNHSVPVDFFDLKGHRYVLLESGNVSSSEKGAHRLTNREFEVASRVAAGDANKAVAFDLGMSMSTVASHLSSAMAKLGVSSRVRLIEEARSLGLFKKKN